MPLQRGRHTETNRPDTTIFAAGIEPLEDYNWRRLPDGPEPVLDALELRMQIR